MASISINASMQRSMACSSRNIRNKQQFLVRCVRSLETNQSISFVAPNVESQKLLKVEESNLKSTVSEKTMINMDNKIKHDTETEPTVSKFFDERWKNGTWDLNMFINNGKMDWDGVIVAEAKRRKYLELNPEASTDEDPVNFRTSIVPWWAWIMHSHLPEAELLNGRAAMVGFFMSYFVDALTGLDVVGQNGNFICKLGLLGTVIGVLLLRRTEDLGKLRKLADEATFYDNQWRASWENQDQKN